MGNKNPNHPIRNRPRLCLFRILHVRLIYLLLSDITATSPPTISPGCLTAETVQGKNLLPFSAVHYSLPISSFSSDSTLQHINVEVVFVQIELSVPVKSPSILNSLTVLFQNIFTQKMILLSIRGSQQLQPMAKRPLHLEVDEFRHTRTWCKDERERSLEFRISAGECIFTRHVLLNMSLGLFCCSRCWFLSLLLDRQCVFQSCLCLFPSSIIFPR